MRDLIIIDGKKYDVKIAISEKEQKFGLMHCFSPVIMAFPTELKYKKFWMHNVPVPLDILFCRNGEVIAVETGIPFNKNQIGPDAKSDLVVEMAHGTIERIGSVRTVELKYGLDSCARSFENFFVKS